MKKAGLLAVLLLIAIAVFGKINSVVPKKVFLKANQSEFSLIHDGDIIFQSSESPQCEAVRIATRSKFSHCGIIYDIKGEKYVYEAVQPVSISPLKDWIKHGKGNYYLVKRLKNAPKVLNKATLDKMKSYGNQFKGKDYDLYFGWGDDRIYCSELVWKIYKNGANIELCKLEKMKHFNLTDPKVKAVLAERYGNKVPLEELVVAPSQLADSPFLETVVDTYKN